RWYAGRAVEPPAHRSCAQIVVGKRQLPYPFSGRREDRVHHRRRCNENRRLAHTTPETAGWTDQAFDLRKFLHQDRRIGVEILLLDPAVFDGDLTMERRAQAKGEGAFDLRLDL